LRGEIYPAKVSRERPVEDSWVQFLEGLKEYGNQFYITSMTGESARIYPDWQCVDASKLKRSWQACLYRTGRSENF